MEGAGGTASLRKAAAHWSLAGDKQLLDLLQNLHERIATKCQEANSSLEEMVTSLDSASISLQNVNNRLMALSNSQFVESRVYEDDVDVAALSPPVKEPPKTAEPASELSKLRDSLRVLEGYHEPVHILDSDSDSVSDDEEDRMVFKPKDLYADRPLPYIIGSQQWRSKWHAGLVAEESDTDSDVSKASGPRDQYSDSEPEREQEGEGEREAAHTDKLHTSQRTISTNSSIGSELTIPTVGKPADIAAELARRLGGNVPHIREPEPESPPRAAAGPTKVYRPEQPVTATIFSDEPPPLDPYQSEQSDSEDDVFAELHRNTSHRQTERSTAGLLDHLFGNVTDVYGRKGSFEDDVNSERQPNPSAKQPSPLFENPKQSVLLPDTAESKQQSVTDIQPDTSVKKPVGGISLFGNNHGTESIGAAILRRNQRKVSTSDEENEEAQQTSQSSNDVDKIKPKADSGHNTKHEIQKDIINDLFSKPNKTKQVNKVEKIKSPVKLEKPVNKKVDLFADDLFDDIDNIFTNVKPPVKEPQESVKKSLFDDEDDDLFANVGATSNNASKKPEIKSKNIFDSDDDLFSEEIVENNAAKLNNDSKFDNVPLSNSDDALFSEEINKVTVKNVIEKEADCSSTLIEKPTTDWDGEHEDNLTNTNNSEIICETKSVQDKISVKESNIKGIFDSDSDDDIFSDLKTVKNISSNIESSRDNVSHHSTNKQMPHISTAIDNNKKIDSYSILNNKDIGATTIKEKNDVTDDDSLFSNKDKPLNEKEVSTPVNENNKINSNVSIDQLEDNKIKTDQVLTGSKGKKFEIENTNAYTEDTLFCSVNKNENIVQDNELPSVLPKPNALKTQFQSPSLFDEDDDLDDIFTKSTDCSESNNDADRNSNISHTEELSEAYSEKNNKSEVHVASNKNNNLIQSVTEPQVIKPDYTEKLGLEKDSTEVFHDSSNDLRQKTDAKLVSNSLQESEVSNDNNVDYPVTIPKMSMDEEKKTEYDNTLNDFQQEESLFFDTKGAVLDEPDIFSDIFTDIPPEFEKPKEPKRSKNVNALFDDDSDDETLFFKKNDIVTDEKPDVSFSSQDDRLFHIFHDEPPAMDVDFTQKSTKHVGSDLETPSDDSYPKIIPSQTHEQRNVKPFFKEETSKEPKSFVNAKTEKSINESKKPVGKLKPMNFNINVSSLLPGASPKKNKSHEQIDGKIISTKSIEDDAVDEESKMVKSVSFEGDLESEVLDNKLSKERAKIQVKRRPSSRRARKEAVRKSGIDFGDDSTDNSNSIDVSKKDDSIDIVDNLQASNNTGKNEDIVNEEVLEGGRRNSNIIYDNEVTDSTKRDVFVEKELKSSKEEESKLFNNNETNISEHAEDSNLTTAFVKRPNVTSKVVYILNDEDIFTDSKPVTDLSDNIQKDSEYNQKIDKSKLLNIVDDDDELFKAGASKNTNITTLGNVYKDGTLKNNEIDKFDSNEDIFKASQSIAVKNTELSTKSGTSKDEIDKLEANIDKLFVKTQSTKVKSSLFEDLSDDENELFGSKKSVKNPNNSENSDGLSVVIQKEVKLPKNDVKRSLFGDESNDDDLFAVRPTKTEYSQPLSKPKDVTSRPTEPVFEDPLSLLRDEEDM